jgi:hypothetical protein
MSQWFENAILVTKLVVRYRISCSNTAGGTAKAKRLLVDPSGISNRCQVTDAAGSTAYYLEISLNLI